MANNTIKYTRIDVDEREQKRQQWNRPIFWPLLLVAGLVAILLAQPMVRRYRNDQR